MTAADAVTAIQKQQKPQENLVIPKDLIKKAGAKVADTNKQEENSSVFDDEEEDDSPRNFIKVFEVECYYEDADTEGVTNASPSAKQLLNNKKRSGISLKRQGQHAAASKATSGGRDSAGLKKGFRRKRTTKKSQSNAQLVTLVGVN